MRLSGPPPGGASGSNPVSVQPVGGAVWQLATPGSGANSAAATETILNLFRGPAVWGASIVGTAGAGNKAIAELNNPAASGKTVFVYSIDMFVPVAMAVDIFADGTTLTPVGVGVNLQFGGAGGVAKVGGGNQLAPTGSLWYTSPSLAINVDYTIPLQWVCSIPPGHNMQLQGQTVNQAFTCNVRWIELGS